MNIHEKIELEKDRLRRLAAFTLEKEGPQMGEILRSVFDSMDSLEGYNERDTVNSRFCPLMPTREHPLDHPEYGLKFLDADLGPVRVVGVLSEIAAGDWILEQTVSKFFIRGVYVDSFRTLKSFPLLLLETYGQELHYREYGSYDRLALQALNEAMQLSHKNPKIGSAKLELEEAVRQHITEEI